MLTNRDPNESPTRRFVLRIALETLRRGLSQPTEAYPNLITSTERELFMHIEQVCMLYLQQSRSLPKWQQFMDEIKATVTSMKDANVQATKDQPGQP